MERACNEALVQIDCKKYASYLKDEGMKQIIRYGIAFYKKYCKVMKGEL
jgi:hypothetical protein